MFQIVVHEHESTKTKRCQCSQLPRHYGIVYCPLAAHLRISADAAYS